MTRPIEHNPRTEKDATGHLRLPVILSELRVTRTSDGRFLAAWAGQQCHVNVTTCFPWSAPTAYISLRDMEGGEVALIPSLDDIDGETRAVLESALQEAAFAFEITSVNTVRKEFEIRQWDVQCAQGPRVFQTKSDEYPQILPPHGLLITDVAGDVYVVQDWTTLDRHSRKELALFVD